MAFYDLVDPLRRVFVCSAWIANCYAKRCPTDRPEVAQGVMRFLCRRYREGQVPWNLSWPGGRGTRSRIWSGRRW